VRVIPKKNILCTFFLAALPASLAGQAMVEHAAISGGAATAAGSAKSAASAIGGTLKKLDGALDTAGKETQSATAPARSRAAARHSKPAKTYEDPAGIKAGMSDLELLRRFGEPSMRITNESGQQTLYYVQQDGRGPTQVRVSGGAVLSVDAPSKPAASAVE
jgi:hypothetical protein